MTPLQKSLNDYLALRRALGFKLTREGMWLPSFVRAVEAGGSFITTKIALRWAMGEKTPPPKSWPNRLSMARKFAQYLHAHNPRHEVTSADLAPRVRSDKRFEPYIYSDNDVLALMSEARQIRTRFKGETYSTLIGLLAATGMRVGEAIGLDRPDFDSRQGLLQIRNTKFGKSRQVLLHSTTTKALCEYARKRDREVLHPSNQERMEKEPFVTAAKPAGLRPRSKRSSAAHRGAASGPFGPASSPADFSLATNGSFSMRSWLVKHSSLQLRAHG